MKKNPVMTVVNYIIIIIVMFIYIFPLFYLFNVSLQDSTAYLINPAAITRHLEFGNYLEAWKRGNFGAYIFNSIFYTVTATFLTILMALLPAFPIARKYIKASGAWFSLFMAGMFLPNGLIPFFQMMLHMHMYNTPWAFILSNLSFNFIFIMFTGYIKSIPGELDQAASIDGCGYTRYLFTMVVPLMKPAIATGVILSAIGVWNNIIAASIFLSDKKLYPIVLGLFKFYGQYSNDNTVLAAAVTIVAMPLIILYIFLQKYIIDGAMAGSIKA